LSNHLDVYENDGNQSPFVSLFPISIKQLQPSQTTTTTIPRPKHHPQWGELGSEKTITKNMTVNNREIFGPAVFAFPAF
jgi:hypothetical protein